MTEKNVTGAKIYVKDGVDLDAALGIIRAQEGIGSIDASKLVPACGSTCAALAVAQSANVAAMTAQSKVAVLEVELAGFRTEVQTMINAATATEKARLWNINCFVAGREDLQVQVGDFADDAFKIALVSAIGVEGMRARGVSLTIGETPPAPWL